MIKTVLAFQGVLNVLTLKLNGNPFIPDAADEHKWNSELLPIYFLKIPKTGGNFGTTLAYSVCADYLNDPPVNGTMIKSPIQIGSTGHWNRMCHGNYFSRFDKQCTIKSEQLEENRGHIAGLFRDPKQRIISGWYHGKHDCETAHGMTHYKHCVEYCQQNYLSGTGCQQPHEDRQAQYETALNTLDAYGFVGLTDEYDLTVCLFHAMYPTLDECKEVEFGNARPGAHHSAKYDADKLLGANFVPGDTKIYNRAKEVFWANIEKYNVNRETCEKIHCKNAPQFFAISADQNVSLANSDFDFKYDWPGRYAYDVDDFEYDENEDDF